MLTLLRDPYILVAAGKVSPHPNLPIGSCLPQTAAGAARGRAFLLFLPTRSPLLLQHGGGHAGTHPAHLDDANHVLPEMAAR